MLILPSSGKGQAKDNIEFSAFSIYNMQGKYVSQFGNVSYTNYLKLSGTDLGFKVDYKRLLYGTTYFKIGLGYMKFAVDKISSQSEPDSSEKPGDSRPINYPGTTFVLYSTTKYHYNTLLFYMGVERKFSIRHELFFNAGVDYYFANNISQKYYVPKIQGYYITANQGSFGSFVNLNLGVSTKVGKFSFLPALVIPIYKSWKQDIVFRENPNNTVSNWGNGIGIYLSLSYR